MENNHQPDTRKEMKFGLTPKFVIGMILIVLAITGSTIIVGAQTYWNSTTNHYNDVAYRTARAAEGYFT